MSRRRTNHRAAEPSAGRSASASAVRQSFAVKVVAPSVAALLVSAWKRQPSRRRDWRENGARSASGIKRDILHPKPRSRSYRRFRGFCAIVAEPSKERGTKSHARKKSLPHPHPLREWDSVDTSRQSRRGFRPSQKNFVTTPTPSFGKPPPKNIEFFLGRDRYPRRALLPCAGACARHRKLRLIIECEKTLILIVECFTQHGINHQRKLAETSGERRKPSFSLRRRLRRRLQNGKIRLIVDTFHEWE